jgi:uncharacterized membrane protein
MVIKIEDVMDVAKLIGALRLMVKGEYVVSKDVIATVINRLQQFAKENGVSIKVQSPSGNRILEITATGAVIGAMVGFYFAGVPGACVGAAIGAGLGFSAASFTLVMSPQGDDYFLQTV